MSVCHPPQVLAKSCKMVPVMVMSTLIGGKLYTSLEYGCAVLIAAGISLFAKQSSSKVTAKLAAPNAPLGYSLCSLNLIFDGYTNAMQVLLLLRQLSAVYGCPQPSSTYLQRIRQPSPAT